MFTMQHVLVFLLGALGAAIVNGEMDCEWTKTVRCSSECNPVCAGNDTHRETFINGCMFAVQCCNSECKGYNYKIIDENNACPINCDIKRKCSTATNTICVKNPEKSFSESFTNSCIFSNDYCNKHKKTLGLKYCIYNQPCW